MLAQIALSIVPGIIIAILTSYIRVRKAMRSNSLYELLLLGSKLA